MTKAQLLEYKHNRNSYYIGTVLSLVLTLIAFASVWMKSPKKVAVGIIVCSALAQIVVQLRYFLHIRWRGQTREDLQLIIFSTVLLVIMVAGTLWVMSDLAYMMMPMSMPMP